MKKFFMRSKLMFTGIGFWVSTLVVTLLCCCNTAYWAFMNKGLDVTQTMNAPGAFILVENGGAFVSYISLVYVFLLLLPFCFSFCKDTSLNITCCLQTRMTVRGYHYGNLLLCFIGSFLVFAIPMLLEAAMNHCLFQNQHVLDFTYTAQAGISGEAVGDTFFGAMPFKRLYINHMELYNVLYALLFSLMAGLMGGFVYALSYYCKGHIILLLLPLFILIQIQDKVDAISQQLFGTYVELELTQYVLVNGMRGQCWIYVLVMLALMVGITVLILERQCRKDQLT